MYLAMNEEKMNMIRQRAKGVSLPTARGEGGVEYADTLFMMTEALNKNGFHSSSWECVAVSESIR